MKLLLTLILAASLQGCAMYMQALLESRSPEAQLDRLNRDIERYDYELRKHRK